MSVGGWDAASLVLGAVVVIALALLTSPLAEQTDGAMVWEGRVAVGFAAMVFVGPFWIAQGIVSVLATLDDGGVWPGWLWTWFLAAPIVGASPPAAALARMVRRTIRPHNPRPDPNAVAAVQQEANFAWAATEAGPGWELRRTPPLPQSWPPVDGGSAVWFCYAERVASAVEVEVAAPWARIRLAPGPAAWPVVERLSDVVKSIGLQSLTADRKPPATGPLVAAVHRGEPRVAKTLRAWRTRNGLLAAYPAVAGHLPPA